MLCMWGKAEEASLRFQPRDATLHGFHQPQNASDKANRLALYLTVRRVCWITNREGWQLLVTCPLMPLSFKAFISSWVSFWDFPSSTILRLSAPASFVSENKSTYKMVKYQWRNVQNNSLIRATFKAVKAEVPKLSATVSQSGQNRKLWLVKSLPALILHIIKGQDWGSIYLGLLRWIIPTGIRSFSSLSQSLWLGKCWATVFQTLPPDRQFPSVHNLLSDN